MIEGARSFASSEAVAAMLEERPAIRSIAQRQARRRPWLDPLELEAFAQVGFARGWDGFGGMGSRRLWALWKAKMGTLDLVKQERDAWLGLVADPALLDWKTVHHDPELRLDMARSEDLEEWNPSVVEPPVERSAWAQAAAHLFNRGWLVTLLLAVSGVARADCQPGQHSFETSPVGKFRLCPPAVDSGGNAVSADYYDHCLVQAVWPGGGSASVTLASPAPGVSVLVGFPGASGVGGVTASCTNSGGETGAVAAAVVTFHTSLPVPPSVSP